MRTPIKLAAFAGGLLLAFGAAYGVGAAAGNPVTPRAPEHGAGSHREAAAAAAEPGGLQVAQAGYRLELARGELAAGRRTVAFRIRTDDGRPLTAYERRHDQDLHLLVVRRDLTGFQHVHPKLAADGTWSIPVDLTPGTWRVLADFVPAAGPAPGQHLTLGADVQVPGSFAPQQLPSPATTAAVDDYTVRLTGALTAGQSAPLTLSVAQGGRPVTDLQPYLAAYGHLVALREGDLAYVHVHPDGASGDGRTPAGPGITFQVTAPTAGAYRLFLDFRHDDVVRTAEFTVVAGQVGATVGPENHQDDSSQGGGHDHGPEQPR